MKPLTTAAHTQKPDYAGLVLLLPSLRRLPDAAGMTTLEPTEAERIRNLGFYAHPGAWLVPRLPVCLIAGNPVLEPLGSDVDGFWHPRGAERCQGAVIVQQDQALCLDVATGAPVTLDDRTEPSEVETWNKETLAILEAITRAGGSIERRKLQKKFWRMGATAFNAAVQRLITEDLITVEGKLFHAVQPPGHSVFHTSEAPGMDRGPEAARPALAVFGKED